jgi:putative dehydrogenase
MRTVGFIGLGAMGMPMARNLIRAGFETQGFDLRESARDEFATGGGKAVLSAEYVSRDADVLVLMVVDSAQVEGALFNAGALNALPGGAVVILASTCHPSFVRALAERVEAAGRRFLDAPVSGGTVGAVSGTLSIMAAGPTDVFEAVRPVLNAFGDKVFHVGLKPGQGAAIKTLNQLLCGVHLAAVAETVAFAEKIGVDIAMALEILSGSAATSWMLRNRGPRMLQTEPEVTSTVDIFVKDLGVVLDAAREVKAALPLAAAAYQMFLSTSACGDGRADDSQVIRSYRLLNGSSRLT